MAGKNYLDLKSEVWDAGRCSGCGACTAVCPADALVFPEKAGTVSPVSNGYCKEAIDNVPCGACYAACPRVVQQPSETLGSYLEIVSGNATFDIPGKQSGGAVTAILACALEAGLIDAVVTVTEDRWTLRPSSAVITKSDVLVSQAGSRYSWWVPLLGALEETVVQRKYSRIAVVGVPCVIQAIARMRASENDLIRPYGRAIRLAIGLFCTESFDYNALVQNTLRQKHDLEPFEIKKLDVKGKLEILKKDDTTLTIPLSELETCIRTGCHCCTDLTAVLSDISAGSIGSPAVKTTLVIRTKTGQGFVQNAVQRKALVTGADIDTAAIEKLAQVKMKKAGK
jgi:coenzyme F420 hydrogenase subunit beta